MKDKIRRLMFAVAGIVGLVASVKLIANSAQPAVVVILAVLHIFISTAFIAWAFEKN